MSSPSPALADQIGLLHAAETGDRRATARLLTLAERGELERLPGARNAHVIGVTGAPGAGKSSLVSALVRHFRRVQQRVAVAMIDPSSPVTGGAILGDRVRLAEWTTDDGVFLRSLATRGHLGGLASATADAVDVFDVAGWPTVIVETVGVGQVEVDVMGLADTTVVVLTPGMGDSIQAAKAGLMEIGDVFVVNKADLPGAAAVRRDVEAVLSMRDAGEQAPVLAVSAATGEGVEELADELDHQGRRPRTAGARDIGLMIDLAERDLRRRLRRLADGAAGRDLQRRVAAGTTSPQEGARQLVGLAFPDADGRSPQR